MMPSMQGTPARSRTDAETELPTAVAQVLRQVPDGQFRARLYMVLTAATRAIIKLREIDLSRIEHLAASQEGSDLALWEQVAPAVGASVGDVNGLLTTISEQFPAAPKAESGDDFDLAFGPASDTPSASQSDVPVTPEERIKAAEKVVHSISESLRFEVSRFGARVRNPSVVADRWNLLVDLQEFRGKCRAAIGELVYAATSAFAEISRPLVVPEYATDLAEGLAVRQAWITLTRAAGPLNARLQIAGVEQQRPLLLAIQRELDHFRSSRGYLHMRAADKRFVIAFAHDLSEVFAKRTFGKGAQQLVEGFAKFLDSLAVINRREILINHDREAFAECGTLLEQSSLHLGVGEHGKAMAKLTQALAVATRLYGRDRYLDDYLVLRLRWPLENLVDAALGNAVEELRACLAESGSHAPGTIF
jgi:hypothetical protein